jgi:hypothetical protein
MRIPRPDLVANSVRAILVASRKCGLFASESPADANDRSETTVTLGCRLGMAWHSIVGFEQGQASGSDRIFRLFVDLNSKLPASLPQQFAGCRPDGFYRRRLRFWSNSRLTSAPWQFGLANAVPAVDAAMKCVTVGDIAQAVALLGGLAYGLTETADAALHARHQDVWTL